MKDWLGNEYDVGDQVVYAAMSGRSITMVLAEVVRIFEAPKYGLGYKPDDQLKPEDMETHVQVQPLKSSRWEQHYGRTRYIDTRTGKGIDPFSGNDKHMIGNYYEHSTTGERVLSREAANERDDFPSFDCYWEWGAPNKTPEGWRFVPQTFKPYVQKVEEGPKPVTLSITENIMLWRKANSRSEGHPEWKACQS